jgi:hypothetical protein
MNEGVIWMHEDDRKYFFKLKKSMADFGFARGKMATYLIGPWYYASLESPRYNPVAFLQGSYAVWKSLNSLEFHKSHFQTLKSLEISQNN